MKMKIVLTWKSAWNPFTVVWFADDNIVKNVTTMLKGLFEDNVEKYVVEENDTLYIEAGDVGVDGLPQAAVSAVLNILGEPDEYYDDIVVPL